MKKYATVFDFVAREFNKAGVRHVLIGGFAVNVHHVTRATTDADFLIATDDLDKAVDIVETAGYQAMTRSASFVLFKSNDLRDMDLDLILVDRDTLDGILKEAVTATLGGNKFRVPSLNHLIALKLHAIKNRPTRHGFKDLQDVLDLIDRNHIDVRSDGFHSLCLTFGTQETYDEIAKYYAEDSS